MSGWFLADYRCEACGKTCESLEKRPAPESIDCECGSVAEKLVGATKHKRVWGWAASTGKSDERPPWALNTEPLAEGMGGGTWRKQQRKKTVDQRRAWVRKQLG